ncbi:MAG TPA: glycosyltransferase family 2 protein, partial [Tianweitania sediminis]|nr:glycosyltransferase family 2 protein [Tianweitania sediminis]
MPASKDLMLSVVIPCRNEAENLPILLAEINAALAGRVYETIVVDDGSTDRTPQVLAQLRKEATTLRQIRHDQSAGQSAAVRSGVFAAHGQIILTIDGDGQNDPAYLPALADALVSGGPGTGIAAGQRVRRKDSPAKQMASRFANSLRQTILKDHTTDTGCGLKALHADLFKQLPFFDGWHRYLPALVIREGFNVVHIEVVDRPRRHGVSN